MGKATISDELERHTDGYSEALGEERRRQREEEHQNADEGGATQKPSIEALCQRYKMTMARVAWLHQLFESYLQPEEAEEEQIQEESDEEAEGKQVVRCNYPENPASIKKGQMRDLISEVNPDLEEADFEARFRRIDHDGNGSIEFDEFVYWIHEDDIAVVGGAGRKMPIEELAVAHSESVALIKYLHMCYKEQLPEGVEDNYPDAPACLSKDDAWDLVQIVAPSTDVEGFERPWQVVDITGKGKIDFDEFLEVLDLDAIPENIREAYQ